MTLRNPTKFTLQTGATLYIDKELIYAHHGSGIHVGNKSVYTTHLHTTARREPFRVKETPAQVNRILNFGNNI